MSYSTSQTGIKFVNRFPFISFPIPKQAFCSCRFVWLLKSAANNQSQTSPLSQSTNNHGESRCNQESTDSSYQSLENSWRSSYDGALQGECGGVQENGTMNLVQNPFQSLRRIDWIRHVQGGIMELFAVNEWIAHMMEFLLFEIYRTTHRV